MKLYPLQSIPPDLPPRCSGRRLIALAAGYSYGKLATHYGEEGRAFTFLREINADGFAGSLSWLLIVGYGLTNAVYAFTFGQYLAMMPHTPA